MEEYAMAKSEAIFWYTFKAALIISTEYYFGQAAHGYDVMDSHELYVTTPKENPAQTYYQKDPLFIFSCNSGGRINLHTLQECKKY